MEGYLESQLIEDFDYIIDNYFEEGEFQDSIFLITGATGFIGSYLSKFLLYFSHKKKQNIRVKALVRDQLKAEQVFGDPKSWPGLEFLLADLTKPLEIEAEVDYLVHTASPTSSSYFISHPVETMRTILEGTRQVLELARRKTPKKTLLLSTMEVYGSLDLGEVRIKEDDYGYLDPLNVRSSYSQGKRMAESLFAAYGHQYGLNLSIARLAQTFGPGVGEGDQRVFLQFARSLLRGEDIVLHTRGGSMGNYCDIRDCTVGLLTLLLKGEKNQAYNLVNEASTMTIKEMAEMLVLSFGQDKTNLIFQLDKDGRRGYAPVTKIKLSSQKMEALGWQAEIGLEESYKRLLRSLEERTLV